MQCGCGGFEGCHAPRLPHCLEAVKAAIGTDVAAPPVERCTRKIMPGLFRRGRCVGAILGKCAKRRYSGSNQRRAQMGISGIGTLLGTSSADAVYKVGLGSNTIRSRSDSSDSGDTVDISDEAKKLFSEKIHMYDKGSSSAGTSAASNSSDEASSESASSESQSGEESSQSGGIGGGSGGAGGSSSTDGAVERIKKQIQALKSQLNSVASHAGSGNESAVESKVESLEAQIASLEAQLAEAMSTSS